MYKEKRLTIPLCLAIIPRFWQRQMLLSQV